MTRRIVGIAHVADLESVADADARSVCERRALRLARKLITTPGAFATAAAVMEAVEAERVDGAQPFEA